ncbi:MAG: hypothetical protein GX654_09195 [Desulfatiglans sp.]|nr:hypothetical protein [Desulfatiglans sp.]
MNGLISSIEIIQIGYPLFDGLPQRVDTAKRMKGKISEMEKINFTEGCLYLNRRGAFKVLSIDGDEMRILFIRDNEIVTTTKSFQSNVIQQRLKELRLEDERFVKESSKKHNPNVAPPDIYCGAPGLGKRR